MLISEIRDRMRQGLLDFAWRQWSQIGVSSSAAGDDWSAIDPEALILFTAEVARHDPRLFDEMLDWIALNYRLLSMQRLRNLTSRFPVDARLVTAVIAWGRESDPAPLAPVADKRRRDAGHLAPAPDEPHVFSSDVLGFIPVPDPIFAEHGFVRPVAVRSGKSREPDVSRPANLAFRLRDMFGPGGRAEVMRVLLSYSSGQLDAARIASEAGFAKRNVSESLVSLAAAGVIQARWAGNERHFTARRDSWAAVFGLDSAAGLPSFTSWVHLLPAALQISMWLNEEAGTQDSEYLLSSQARNLMDRVARDLELADIQFARSHQATGTGYLRAFADETAAILTRMGVMPP
ncbi:MAG: hypothetical protein ACRDNW_06485 [Trebonia sp.]